MALTGTCVVPGLYLCGTCVVPVLADLSRLINCCMAQAGLYILLAGNISCWYMVGTIFVPVWYLGGTHVALVWYKCCISMVLVWHPFGFLVGRPGQVFKLLADLHRSLYCSFAIIFLPPTHPSCWFGFATDAASCLVGFVSALCWKCIFSQCIAELNQ